MSMFRKQPAGFDLTASLTRKQHDPCWFLETAPASFDIIGHINRVVARGDIRSMFAKRVARRG